jgi:uncharacterized delta-60 repeat protein
MEFRNTLTADTMLRQYRIERVLGQGGFGITYLAYDTELQRQVAIKECYPRDFVTREGTTVVSSTPKHEIDYNWAISKFMDEATTLAKFRHPGIVQVLQILKGENNTAYMVLEYIEGQSLDRWAKSLPAPANQAQLIEVATPILDALEAVHRENFAHRDIAPDNIYVRPTGEALLLDFGAARLTIGHHSKTLNLVVKDGYSAPEQYYAEGRQGPWTDIYALAATLYRIIAGKRPIDAMARLDAINNSEPDPLVTLDPAEHKGYSAGFLAAIERGMAPQAKARPQSITEWRSLLLGDLAPQPEPKPAPVAARTPPHAPAERPKPEAPDRRRISPLVIAGGVALAAIVTAGSYWAYTRSLVAAEAEAWNAAANADREAGYNSFIADHPASPRLAEAKEALARLSSPWTQTLGDGAKGQAFSVIATQDGIGAAGYVETGTRLGRQAVVYSLSRSGKTIWRSLFGEEGNETFRSLLQLPDGGIVAAGETQNGNDRPDAIIARFSATGALLWSRRFGGPGADQLTALRRLSSGNIVAVGSTTKNVNSNSLGWLLMLNPDGELMEERTFDAPGGGIFTSAIETAGGGMVLAGGTGTKDTSAASFWIVRLSSDGSVLLDRQPGGKGFDRLNGIAEGTAGEIVMAGETTSFGTGTLDGIIFRLTADNKMPPKVIAKMNEDSLNAIISDADGFVHVAGKTTSAGGSRSAAWVMKLSPDVRDVLWESTIPHSDGLSATSLARLPDGTLVVGGYSGEPASGNVQFWLTRLPANGGDS